MNNRQQLHALIKELELTRKDAASILGISVHTLNNWLTPETSKCSRPCPEWPIKLLTMHQQIESARQLASRIEEKYNKNAPN